MGLSANNSNVLYHGASVNVTESEDTPLQIAVRNGRFGCVGLIGAGGVDINGRSISRPY